MEEKKKKIKVIRIYLEDFEARKYEIVRIPRTVYNNTIKDNFAGWLDLINKTRNAHYTARVLTGNHLCHYCGGFTDGRNYDELCIDCKRRFGVTYYKQIKSRDAVQKLMKDDGDEQGN